MMDKRPLDALNKSKGKNVYVILKNGREITGKLQALDIHLNMWLEDAEMTYEEKKTTFGDILIRGDSIVLTSPSNQ